jgi:cobalt/nickel transport system permease protein
VKHNFLDRYRGGESPVHVLDPRLKLLATLAFVLVVTSTPVGAWSAFLLLTAEALVVVLLARMRLLEALKLSVIALPFAGAVAVSLPFTRGGRVLWAWPLFGRSLTVTDEGLLLFATVVVKAWLAGLFAAMLMATTSFTGVLKSMRFFRVPAILTSTIAFMYRYLFVLFDEAMRIQTAREARSAGMGGTLVWRMQVLGGMIGSLFIRSYERSERVYAAMLSRGFSGQVRPLVAFAWRRRDSWAALGWSAALAIAAVLGQVAT